MFRAIIRPKHVELTEIFNELLLLHLVGCLYYIIYLFDSLYKIYNDVSVKHNKPLLCFLLY